MLTVDHIITKQTTIIDWRSISSVLLLIYCRCRRHDPVSAGSEFGLCVHVAHDFASTHSQL